MEILSRRPKILSLEARHTISLEVSKQRRLKFAKSLFIPRKSSKPFLPTTCREKAIMFSKPSHSPDRKQTKPAEPPLDNTNTGLGVITYLLPETNYKHSAPNYKIECVPLARIHDNAPKQSDPPQHEPPQHDPLKSKPPKNPSKKTKPLKKREVKPQNTKVLRSFRKPNNNEFPMVSIPLNRTQQEVGQYIPPNLTSQKVDQYFPELNQHGYQTQNEPPIEISSDEEDTKVFVRLDHLTALGQPQTPKQISDQPVQTMSSQNTNLPQVPIQNASVRNAPAPNVTVQNGRIQNRQGQNATVQHLPAPMGNIPPPGNYRPQYQPYPSVQANYNRNVGGYQPQFPYMPDFCQAPVNYKPGFYTESYPNSYRQPGITYPNQIKPELRYRPYHERQIISPYQPQAQPLPELASLPNQSNALYPTNLSSVDIPKLQQSGYQPSVNQTQVNYGPIDRQPVQKQELVPFSTNNSQLQFQAMFEWLKELYQAEVNRGMPPIQSNEFWSQNNTPESIEYALSILREAGIWNPTQLMMRRRMENNPGSIHNVLQQTARPIQLSSSPRAYPDSTTERISPASSGNTSRPLYVPSPRYPPNDSNFYASEQNFSNPGNNSTTISPAMGQAPLNESISDGYYRNLVNLPEFDPRQNR